MKHKGRTVIRWTKPALLDQEDNCPTCTRLAGFTDELGTLIAAIARSNEQRSGRGLVEAHVCAKCKNHVSRDSVRWRPMKDFADPEWADIYEQIQDYDMAQEIMVAFVEPDEHFALRRLSKPQPIKA